MTKEFKASDFSCFQDAFMKDALILNPRADKIKESAVTLSDGYSYNPYSIETMNQEKIVISPVNQAQLDTEDGIITTYINRSLIDAATEIQKQLDKINELLAVDPDNFIQDILTSFKAPLN